MDNNNLSIQVDLIINYLNNIININILLVTVGLVLIYWTQKNKHLEKNSHNKCWGYFIYIAVLVGIVAIIINLFMYRNIISEFTSTGLNPNKPYSPKLVKHLSALNLIFYLDLIILMFLFVGFHGKNYEKRNK